MRTLNKIDLDFLKDLKDLYLKYKIEIEIFLPEFSDKKDYMYEIVGQSDFQKEIDINTKKLYLFVYSMPTNSL